MRVASLVSGGKDSVFASYCALNMGWEVAAYVTLEPEDPAPMLFHRPNTRWVALQAEAAGVPWRRGGVARGTDEAGALEGLLRGLNVDGITTGALASEYQRTRFEAVCHGLGLKTFSPLWHHDPTRHLRDLVGSGIRSVLVHVSAEGLGREWLGRELDAAGVEALGKLAARRRIHPAGEGGEYETLVLDAPHFSRRVVIERSHVEGSRDAATLVVDAAKLAPK